MRVEDSWPDAATAKSLAARHLSKRRSLPIFVKVGVAKPSTFNGERTINEFRMGLGKLLEKGGDGDLLRDMIGFRSA